MLVSFSAALVVGVVAGNSTLVILWRAILVMLIAWAVGRIIGAIAQHAVDDHLAQYKKDHPIPGEGAAAADPEAAASE